MDLATCPHCKEGTNFEIKPMKNRHGTGNIGQALCCLSCGTIVHVYEGHALSNYGPLLGNILTELQAISKKLDA